MPSRLAFLWRSFSLQPKRGVWTLAPSYENLSNQTEFGGG